MICFRILYLTSLLLFGINISLWGYEKRELLQKEVTLDELKSTLVTEQKWVIYPPYSDRKQWNALLGDYKDHLIRQGEQFLKYNWLCPPGERVRTVRHDVRHTERCNLNHLFPPCVFPADVIDRPEEHIEIDSGEHHDHPDDGSHPFSGCQTAAHPAQSVIQIISGLDK